jgi:hypothetical protein
MNQFEMMVNQLFNSDAKWNLYYSDEEFQNASLAMVEGVLLNGYTITDNRVYKTTLKKVTELVNE